MRAEASFRVIRVAPGTASAMHVPSGGRIRILEIEGAQVCDLIALHADDLSEFLSPSHTIVSLGRLSAKAGDELRTNRRRPILRMTRDGGGSHDLVVPACDPWRYEYDYGVVGHPNCSDSFVEALRPWAIQRERLPHPVNLFQRMDYSGERIVFLEPTASRGDVVEFETLMNALVAVSACPMDLNPISGYRPKAIAVEIVDSSARAR